MKLYQALVVLPLATVLAQGGQPHARAKCGNEFISEKETYDALAKAADTEPAVQEVGAPRQAINIYYHVIGNTTVQAAKNKVPEDLLRKQTDVLNTAYRASGFKFAMVNASYTGNKAWADGGYVVDTQNENVAVQLNLKSQLRKGNYRDLNLYILQDYYAVSKLYGYCPFPRNLNYAKDRELVTVFNLDGCYIDVGTLPRQESLPQARQGKTLVHEVGHWLGLIHVWGDLVGCLGDDGVRDTPVQYAATLLNDTDPCPPLTRNTCPEPGNDNVDNYMDYTADQCLTRFTAGQMLRMTRVWNNFRRNARSVPTI